MLSSRNYGNILIIITLHDIYILKGVSMQTEGVKFSDTADARSILLENRNDPDRVALAGL